MKVDYILDKEGGIDPTDPLGDLTLHDEKSNSFTLKCTFIDVWLSSFLENLSKIDKKNR